LLAEAPPAYRTPYSSCPICGVSEFSLLATGDCTKQLHWHPPLPERLTWLRCNVCTHVFTDSFYTDAGLSVLFSKSYEVPLTQAAWEQQRFIWGPVVERIVQVLPSREALFDGALSWVDVGCGSGGLVFTASEFGFEATGLDLNEEIVRRLQEAGYRALYGSIMNVQADKPLHVISMADVLEHMPYPVGALQRAHELLDDQGVLFISCPNRECASWQQMDRRSSNPYWAEFEHYHNFSRSTLTWILRQCGFTPLSYSVSRRYIACMEIVAVKAGSANPACHSVDRLRR
jgi:protein O-GlcNAc transferase